MGDLEQILGKTQAQVAAHQSAPALAPSIQNPPKAIKLSGVSREVMHLLSGNQDVASASLPPIVPTFSKQHGVSSGESKEVSVKVGNKWISSSKQTRKWTWAPFASSSRTDGALFRHWVRANVEYTDYPYAKFDIHLEPVVYTDEEYSKYLTNESWTKSETDKLMELARKHELRWAVIQDRWYGHYASEENDTTAARPVEDLQQRYYNIAAVLAQMRISQEATAEAQKLAASVPDLAAGGLSETTENLILESVAAKALGTAAPNKQPLMNNIATGTSNKLFDVEHERERRAHLDRLWRREKEEEIEEIQLRKELRLIEAQLRKLKKSGGHILAATQAAAGAAPSRLSSAASSRNPSRSVSPVPGTNIVNSPEMLDRSFASTAPTPMPKTPYLQSGRLVPPGTGGGAGINKSLLTKMGQTLTELKISKNLLPTKRICDMYDSVRKDILTLLTLQKMLMQKEGNLQSKRIRLAKMGGEAALDEEALLGIAPPPAPVPPPAPPVSLTTPKSTKAAARPAKSKPPTTPAAAKAKPAATKTKTTEEANKPDTTKESTGTAAVKKTKPAPKRKRKSDPKTPAAPSVLVSASTAPSVTAAVAPNPPIPATVAPSVASVPAKPQTVAETQPTPDVKQQGAKKRARKS